VLSTGECAPMRPCAIYKVEEGQIRYSEDRELANYSIRCNKDENED
jgi:hypothetical protein